jgi:hypothetical protein
LPLVVGAGTMVLLVATGLLLRRQFRWRAARTWMSRGPTLRQIADRVKPWLARLRRFPGALRDRAGFARWRTLAMKALNPLRTAMHRLIALPGGGAPEPCPTDLNAALRALERSLRRRLPGSVDYRLSLLPELWLCLADPDAVAAAVRDLVAAAVVDMPVGGDLVVGTRQYSIDDTLAAEFAAGAVGDYVRLTVKDNGSGLSGEHVDGIFDRETTVKPAIAAARELTRRLGGFARVESAEGIGTAVHLYFRRADPSAEGGPKSREEAASTTAAAA